MTTEMRFLSFLKDFLRENGEIYTVRKYKMDEREVEIIGVGTCKRIPVGIITNREQLEPYVSKSGFSKLEDWVDRILYYIPNKDDTKYLYHVVRLNGTR